VSRANRRRFAKFAHLHDPASIQVFPEGHRIRTVAEAPAHPYGPGWICCNTCGGDRLIACDTCGPQRTCKGCGKELGFGQRSHCLACTAKSERSNVIYFRRFS